MKKPGKGVSDRINTMKLMGYFFLIILLTSQTACQSSLLMDLIARPGEKLYFDDFSDPTSGWMHTTSPAGKMDYDNGTYQMAVMSPNYDLWAVSGQAYRDVKVEVDVTRLAGPDSNRFGVVCRYHSPTDFYFFIVSSDGYYAIGKVNNGAITLLNQDMMAYSAAIVSGDGPNHLRFDCNGQTLNGYVNGQAVADAKDAAFSNGDTGLIAGAFDQAGVVVDFDNFVVYNP
jgi:hypothetical protein